LQGARSVDSIVNGNAVQAAITGCPQSSECCPPSVGILSALRRIPQLASASPFLASVWPLTSQMTENDQPEFDHDEEEQKSDDGTDGVDVLLKSRHGRS